MALLDRGADLNARDDDYQTPLHTAAWFNETPEVIRTLVDGGADVDARDNWGDTPLHTAARYNESPDVIRALVDAGADPNARNDNGHTPLHISASNENPAVIFTLVDAGADPTLKHEDNLWGETPLDFAHRIGSTAEAIEALRTVSAAHASSVPVECAGWNSTDMELLQSFT